MIKFDKVTKIYHPDVTALEDVSFEIKKGEFVVLAGRSGAGKTTLLKLILGEEPASDGQVFFDEEDMKQVKKRHLPSLRKRIGAVFQDYKLLSAKTVYENVAFALEVIGADDEEIKKYVPQVLDIVGLTPKINKFPRELSAGQRQRTAIARALIRRPEVILADEPTGNLDHNNASEIIKLLLKINELGTTVILATHNKEIIKKLKTRTLLFKEGKLDKDAADGGIIL